MSGGHFNYVQNKIYGAADALDNYIKLNIGRFIKCEGDDEYQPEYKPETMNKLRECVNTLNRAAAMLQRVDLLISGDDSEESFHRMWDIDGYIKGGYK